MSLYVLPSTQDIRRARANLRRRGLSCLTEPYLKALAKVRLYRRPIVGDVLKSWDVLQTIDFVKEHVPERAGILDIGAYASEVLCILSKLGFKDLVGVDLNPDLRNMPLPASVDLRAANFMATPFQNERFHAVTAISVIEHGYNGERLFFEISRLLKPGGYFLASFDYWPNKISTDGIKMFDMEWRIFSREDVSELLRLASGFNLLPVGNLNLDAHERPISCAARDYTFAWMALRKAA